MDTYMKGTLEIVKAQAQIRVMTEDELTEMIAKVYTAIMNIADGLGAHSSEEGACASTAASPVASVDEEVEIVPAVTGRASIKERYILCLECGKKCKFITRKHLATHGLEPDAYRAKWGIKPTQALVCKSLQRERRQKMQSMKLWEKKMKPVK